MKNLCVLVGVLLLWGCGSPVSDQAKDQMAKPIDCGDAQEDIAALEAEKASVLTRVGQGARFVVPVAVVVNIFQEGSGNKKVVSDRKAVASGEYNQSIDAKIAEIKATCNV